MLRRIFRYALAWLGALFVFASMFLLMSYVSLMIVSFYSRELAWRRPVFVSLINPVAWLISSLAATASFRGTHKVYAKPLERTQRPREIQELIHDPNARVASALEHIEVE